MSIDKISIIKDNNENQLENLKKEIKTLQLLINKNLKFKI